MEYVLSMGTNIGDRKQNIEKAIESINSIPYTDVIKCSKIYKTEPVGYARQDDFYNVALLVNSEFEPHEMLGLCLGIEAGFGRKRGIKNGPRILDIDVIFAENEKIDTKNLEIPHPRYNERRFVLEPMLDIFPSGIAYGIDFKQYIQKIDGQGVRAVCEIDDSLIAFE